MLGAKAGLQAGDILVQMAGVRIKNLHDLVYVLRSKRSGDRMEVVFVRNGYEMCGTTILEKRH
ncbi:MAG: PDZ domain-containing protein [Candidatus Methylomirabilales bacterium]